jgi:hypothetical protein
MNMSAVKESKILRMDVKLEAPRYILEPTADGVRVIIATPRNWVALIFLCAWLVGWFFGERSALLQLLGPTWSGLSAKHVAPAFLSVWLVMWTIGGVAVVTTILRQLAGKEIITANPLSLSRRFEVFGFGSTRSYALSEVRDLRATSDIDPRYSRQRALFRWTGGGEGYGAIAFDYGARTIRFAPGIDEAEAKMLVADLMRRVKVQQTAGSML